METQTKQKRAQKTTGRKKPARENVKTVADKNGTSLQVRELDLAVIKPDPKQPRKTFDQESLQLLAQSIAEHGVLQPITVRKAKTGYIIVMGERRYRAGKLAGQKTIPAIVRDYDDDQVLEVQIIENLQRRDVEPTEEAEAMAYLVYRYSPAEIAKRLGRTENFVRQRLKLAGLIEGFKHYVRSGEMTLSLGIAVALFDPEEQQMMLESLNGEFHANKLKRLIENETFNLENAPFDLSDKKLLPKAGACTLCPFNAANQGNLFGEGKMICTRTACFENKKVQTLLNLIRKAKKDKLMLVPKISSYWAEEEGNQYIMARMEEHGLAVHLTDELDILKEPVKPTLEIIRERNQHIDYSDEELQEGLDHALETYAEARKEYDNATGDGFSKGILLHTDSYKSEAILVKLREIPERVETAQALPLDKRKMAECTPEEQIVKIEGREFRKKQIENNRLFEEVAYMIRDTEYINMDKPLSTGEMAAFAISLYENNIGYYGQTDQFRDFYGNVIEGTREEIVARFKEDFKEATLNKLIRYLLTRQVHFGESNHTNDWTNISFYAAMKAYYKKEIEAIEARYAEAGDKREKRVKERIEVLQKQAKALKG
ncbi:ParB/RepB/Spo0J family partition protein [Sinomicrobium weinanense]|uniref:ParB/RepB/Spo0J family partition protein n=1 Tax=Sinomicrobium weinanense TaxID=2842200 RepID=A0A926JQ39_9FLAO|nr:ParB/RepB/Spo0J family partition protein [Sinomicrobium weinanense]MBC9795390.1 ParB/RepB/Spo0J family partition protein [Sinomicrobium weinanense]MBU3122895.1 ParB/RepB/Spo0J family partition protein [Sinomicrobium weinanense]